MFSHPFPGRWLCSTHWPLFSDSHPHLLDRGQVEPLVGPFCVTSLVGKSFPPRKVVIHPCPSADDTLVRLFPSPQGPFCSFPTLLCAHEAVLIGWHLGAPGPWRPDGLDHGRCQQQLEEWGGRGSGFLLSIELAVSLSGISQFLSQKVFLSHMQLHLCYHSKQA